MCAMWHVNVLHCGMCIYTDYTHAHAHAHAHAHTKQENFYDTVKTGTIDFTASATQNIINMISLYVHMIIICTRSLFVA